MSRRKPVNLTCPACATVFAVPYCHRKRRKYCSKACRAKTGGQSQLHRAHLAARVILVCKTCARTFRVPRGRTKNGRAKYCSIRCKQIAAARSPARRAYDDRIRGTGSGYVKRNGHHEHRLVAEQVLGRPLIDGEIVHHKDGNPQNNDPANLLVTTQSWHAGYHSTKDPTARAMLQAVESGELLD